MLWGLKKSLDEAKRAWANELESILWSYQTTPHSIAGETPFKLTYGVDAMILVEVEEPSPKVVFRGMNSSSLHEEADLSNKAKEMAHIQEKALKKTIT